MDISEHKRKKQLIMTKYCQYCKNVCSQPEINHVCYLSKRIQVSRIRILELDFMFKKFNSNGCMVAVAKTS